MKASELTTDSTLLDWLEEHDADVSCLRTGPQGVNRPWIVSTGISQDGRGRTLREAILDAATKLKDGGACHRPR